MKKIKQLGEELQDLIKSSKESDVAKRVKNHKMMVARANINRYIQDVESRCSLRDESALEEAKSAKSSRTTLEKGKAPAHVILDTLEQEPPVKKVQKPNKRSSSV